ncbi:PXDC1 protein, partial [Rynchops niger]|nr:PXDC1 protein [Rynchops niger]
MASAVFEGTSLVNMYVRGCWVNGIRRLIISRRGDEGLCSDHIFTSVVHELQKKKWPVLELGVRSAGRVLEALSVSASNRFPSAPPICSLLPRLITIKEAHDIEARLNEVEKLLKTIINMPWKYSRSEVVLTFFERSPLDQVLKNDNVHKIQPNFQSPVKISEIMRSNGFCLANTETIVIDHSIPNGKEKHLDVDSAEHLFESVSDFTSELEDSDDPTAYVTNLTYYHLVPFETDILD